MPPRRSKRRPRGLPRGPQEPNIVFSSQTHGRAQVAQHTTVAGPPAGCASEPLASCPPAACGGPSRQRLQRLMRGPRLRLQRLRRWPQREGPPAPPPPAGPAPAPAIPRAPLLLAACACAASPLPAAAQPRLRLRSQKEDRWVDRGRNDARDTEGGHKRRSCLRAGVRGGAEAAAAAADVTAPTVHSSDFSRLSPRPGEIPRIPSSRLMFVPFLGQPFRGHRCCPGSFKEGDI